MSPLYRQNKHGKGILDPGNIGNKAKKKRLYLVFLVLIVKVWQLKVSILQFVHRKGKCNLSAIHFLNKKKRIEIKNSQKI